MTQAVPSFFRRDESRVALIVESYRRLLGRELVARGGDCLQALWDAPLAILAHGVQADPLFFFANRAAIAAFETTPEAIIAMPSRLSAEPLARAERQALLDRVNARGFIEDYGGMRISAKGRRFPIAQAVVWNLVDEAGIRHGQAACFQPPSDGREARRDSPASEGRRNLASCGFSRRHLDAAAFAVLNHPACIVVKPSPAVATGGHAQRGADRARG